MPIYQTHNHVEIELDGSGSVLIGGKAGGGLLTTWFATNPNPKGLEPAMAIPQDRTYEEQLTGPKDTAVLLTITHEGAARAFLAALSVAIEKAFPSKPQAVNADESTR